MMMPIRYFSFLTIGTIVSVLFSFALNYSLEQGIVHLFITLLFNTLFYIATGGEQN